MHIYSNNTNYKIMEKYKDYNTILDEIRNNRFDCLYYVHLFKIKPKLIEEDMKKLENAFIRGNLDIKISSNPSYNIYCGIFFYYLGNTKKMLSSFNKAIMMKYPDAYYLVGSYYSSIKNYKLMIKNMAIAADIYNHEHSMIFLAYFYQYVRKNKAYMLKYYKMAINVYNNGYAMYKLGNYYEDNIIKEGPKRMIYYYKKAFTADKNVDALINIGNYYMKIAKYKKMFKYYNMAKKYSAETNNYNVYFYIGYYYQFINFNLKKMIHNYKINIYNKPRYKYLSPSEYNLYNYYSHRKMLYNPLDYQHILDSILFIKYEKIGLLYIVYNNIYIPPEIYDYIIKSFLIRKY